MSNQESHQVITLGQFGAQTINQIIDAEGREWVTRKQIAEALDYLDPTKILKIHYVLVGDGILSECQNGTLSEGAFFTELALSRGHKTIVYNSEAVIEFCLESNKPKAKEFRRWIAKQFKVTTSNGGLEVKSTALDTFSQLPPMMQNMIRLEMDAQEQSRKVAKLEEGMVEDRVRAAVEADRAGRDRAKIEVDAHIKTQAIAERLANVEAIHRGDVKGISTMTAAKRLGWETKSSGKWCKAAVAKAIMILNLPHRGMAWKVPDYTGHPAWHVNQEGFNIILSTYNHVEIDAELEVAYDDSRNTVIRRLVK